jgi:hypothetical protein
LLSLVLESLDEFQGAVLGNQFLAIEKPRDEDRPNMSMISGPLGDKVSERLATEAVGRPTGAKDRTRRSCVALAPHLNPQYRVALDQGGPVQSAV